MAAATSRGAAERPLIKVVVIGDGAVGKTCLLISYKEKVFPSTYVPTVFNNWTKVVDVQNGDETVRVTLDLWDTAGQEEFDRIRYLSYRDTAVFFFCFSVVDPSTFENIKSKWLPEVNYHMGAVFQQPIKMLVGLKSDLKKDPRHMAKLRASGTVIPTDDHIKTWAADNKMTYVEVSAKENINVKEVFEKAIEAFLGDPGKADTPQKGGCCSVL